MSNRRSRDRSTASASELRLLVYSHDGVGLGHVNRNLAPEASLLLATGVEELQLLDVPRNLEVLKLPGLRKVANGRYASRKLAISPDDVLAMRSALLTAAVQSFRPDVMVVDKHPLGACGELGPALEALRAGGGRAVFGLRDILDDPQNVLEEWRPLGLPDLLSEWYDQVLIYGDRTVYDPILEYGFPASVSERTSFCGYVVKQPAAYSPVTAPPPEFAREARSRPIVLATAGGGEDGFFLIRTFINAASGAPWDAIAVTGPLLPEEETQTLRRLAAEAGVTFYSSVPGLSGWFGLVDAVVCMGGYNSLIAAASLGTPTVCVPRCHPRSEQLIRARAFEQRGLLSVIEPEQLNGATLSQEVAAALEQSRRELCGRARAELNFDGARRAAASILALASPETDGTARQNGSGALSSAKRLGPVPSQLRESPRPL